MAPPDYDNLWCRGGSKFEYESRNTVWTVGFVQALQLVLWLYRVDGARVEFVTNLELLCHLRCHLPAQDKCGTQRSL